MKVWMFLVAGFALKFVSGQVEAMGDAQLSMSADASSGRLGYHVFALILLVAAIGCFVAALVSIFSRRSA